MSDADEPQTGHPDHRHRLGVLLGAIARGDVLELHGSDGSATIRVADADTAGLLADVVRDLDTDQLVTDGGETVTCGVCGDEADPETARVLVRETGPDVVLCLACRTAYPRRRQYNPADIHVAARVIAAERGDAE